MTRKRYEYVENLKIEFAYSGNTGQTKMPIYVLHDGGIVILVANKFLDFDAKFLIRNLEEFGFSDLLLTSRQLYTQAISHRLYLMLYEVGLPVRESHNAMEDAEDYRTVAALCGFRCVQDEYID